MRESRSRALKSTLLPQSHTSTFRILSSDECTRTGFQDLPHREVFTLGGRAYPGKHFQMESYQSMGKSFNPRRARKPRYIKSEFKLKVDPRKTQRLRKLITLLLFVAKRFSREIASNKSFLLMEVSRESVETERNAKGLKENFPFSGIRPNSKLRNLVKSGEKKSRITQELRPFTG